MKIIRWIKEKIKEWEKFEDFYNEVLVGVFSKKLRNLYDEGMQKNEISK